EREEAELTAFLDSDEGIGHAWEFGSFNGPSHRKRWGVETDLKARAFKPPRWPMPSIFAPIVERMRAVVASTAPSGQMAKLSMMEFRPNEANAIDYRRDEGHYLKAHCDDRQLSGGTLVNLCLCGDAIMTYTEDVASCKRKRGGVGRGDTDRTPEVIQVELPRRSLQVQSRRVRYDFQHGIPPAGLLSSRRVSITFRQNAFLGHNV
ncbi:unnamed protein product, partial [Polarella glacialis]